MPITISENQFDAFMRPAINYRQAVCFLNVPVERLRLLCAKYGSNVEIFDPDKPIDRPAVIMRLVIPNMRKTAMVMPRLPNLDPIIRQHVILVRIG